MFNQYTFRSMSSINRHMMRMGEAVDDVNNIFTTGYKSKTINFHETLNGLKMEERLNYNDGVAKKTSRELDFAIEGKGFFEVLLPDGTHAYTRDGEFSLGPNGELLSSQGYPVVVRGPKDDYVDKTYDAMTGEKYDVGVHSGLAIVPVGSSLEISEDGTLSTDKGDVIGKINVVNFTNPDALKNIGDNLMIASDNVGSIQEVTLGQMESSTKLRQGYLESSNVSIVDNMAEMVQLNTAVKAELKIVKMLDQMQENLNSTITRNI